MRRGRWITGGITLLAALALAAPAFSDTPSAADQGYPCVTQPPSDTGGGGSGGGGGGGGSETCTQPTTPPVTPPTTPPTTPPHHGHG